MKNSNKQPSLLTLIILLFSLYVSATTSNNQTQTNPSSKHFVLVHGACFGAFAWSKIVPLLEQAGHNVTAIDLAGGGTDPTPVGQIRSLPDYAKPLTNFMAALPANKTVILVAHSLGGASISQAMELYPEKISVAVFLTALMPASSLSHTSLFLQAGLRLITSMDNKVGVSIIPSPAVTFVFGPKYLTQVLFQLSPSESAEEAILKVRPINAAIGVGLAALTEARYGSVKRVFIVSEQDQVLPVEFQRSMISQNPPDKVISINGSDHSVMTSQPEQLVERLLDISMEFA